MNAELLRKAAAVQSPVPVRWVPSHLPCPVGLFSYDTENPDVTAVTIWEEDSSEGFDIEYLMACVSIEFARLKHLGEDGYIYIELPELRRISFPKLEIVDAYFELSGNPKLESIFLPVLHSFTGGDFYAYNCALTADAVNHILARLAACPDFTSNVYLDNGTSAAPAGDGLNSLFTLLARGCVVNVNFINLDSAAINAILAAGVANAGFTSGTLDLDDASNAVPTGQGITDKNTLIARGATVVTN